VSKATTIRKKALDLVRQQDWANAIKEYRRLVELDQNNPNVHNELADLYLRTNQKSEAFDSFMVAIDEYTRVGLFNNAVAVCKKVLRVLPSRVEVLNKLGLIRMKQGLAKEAESYYLSFLEKAAGGSFDSKSFLKIGATIAEEMASSPSVLQKLAQCLLGYKLNDEAGDVLIKLYMLQESSRDTSGCEDTRALAVKLGFGPKLDAMRKTRPGGADRTVVTEDNLWTKAHSEGERIDVESNSSLTPPSQPSTAPASAQPAGAVPGGPSERDQWLLRLARGVGGGPKTKAPAPAPAPAPAAPAAATATESPAAPAPPPPAPEPVNVEPTLATAEAVASEIPVDDVEIDDELPQIPETLAPPPIPTAPPPPAPSRNAPAAAPAVAREPSMQISALIQDDEGEGGSEADYRSHYDLGMAYMEMDLLAEAIREYQVASKSQQFQVKCLEMIGLCFLKQNQPQLAIRQLTKALSLIGNDGDESMGIKYSLGLAYEMTGDLEQARINFEDVYVVDVTFRDVSEKIKKLSGS
jgi:tetratricopeptide (TPR) repeat protein